MITALAIPAAAIAEETSSFTDAQKAELEQFIRSYLIENPEILVEVSVALEAKRASQEAEAAKSAMSVYNDAIFNDPTAPFIGNPDGKIQIVEFFDYNCGFCRRAMGKVLDIAESNKDVKVIFKEMPVLGDESTVAARASLAAAKQDKFLEFHRALMTYEGRISEEAISKAAKQVKLDMAQFESDRNDPAIQKSIDENLAVASALYVNGTPSFIIGDQVVRGWNEAEIDRLIKEASGS